MSHNRVQFPWTLSFARTSNIPKIFIICYLRRYPLRRKNRWVLSLIHDFWRQRIFNEWNFCQWILLVTHVSSLVIMFVRKVNCMRSFLFILELLRNKTATDLKFDKFRGRSLWILSISLPIFYIIIGFLLNIWCSFSMLLSLVDVFGHFRSFSIDR